MILGIWKLKYYNCKISLTAKLNSHERIVNLNIVQARQKLPYMYVLIGAHAPISTHLSYFEFMNHKTINRLPRFMIIHKAYKLSSIWLGISLKMAKIIHSGVDASNNIETNKHRP